MKKFLLSCLTLMLGIGAVSAQNVILDVTPSSSNMDKTDQYTGSIKLTASDTQIFTVSAFSNYNNDASWAAHPMRCGRSKNASVASVASDFAFTEIISKVSFTVYAQRAVTKANVNSIKLYVADNTNFTNATSYDVTFDAFTKGQTYNFDVNVTSPAANQYYKIEFDLKSVGGNGALALDNFKFYGETVAGAVDAPAITCSDNMVIITADAGCEIYYTTDGTEPNTSSAKYNSPFSITAKTTVKAIAVKDGKTSHTTTKECDYIGNYDGFASFAAAGAGTQGTVDGPITAYYQNGQNLYVYDSKNKGMLLFGTTETYTNGDVFESVTGTYTEYGTGKVPEITNYTLGAKSTGSAVSPEDGPSLDEISSNEDWRYKYVKLYDVNITSLNGNNFTIVDSSDETLTLPGYNKFKITVSEGEGFTIEGIVDIFNGNPQIYPISISEGTVYDVVETPVFTPESGATLNIGDEITIACATEGASIHYTTDGSEPTATSEPYTGAAILFTGGTFTVKAIAVKDGMADSDVATATYTEYVEGEETATFNFTTLDDYNAMTSIPQEAAPAVNEVYGISTTDNTSGNDAEIFIAGKFRMTFTKTSGATNPRWFNANNGGLQCRTYKGNIINISSTDSHSFIKGIEITAPNGTTNFGGYDLVPTDKDGVAQTSSTIFTSATKTTWTAAEGAYIPAVTLTNRTTNNTYFTTIKVTYIIDNNVTGIDGIESDDENAPVEYFNLQGIRVNGDNLGTGIYIRRQGSKTTKVLIQR